jgi:hypothetical protein
LLVGGGEMLTRREGSTSALATIVGAADRSRSRDSETRMRVLDPSWSSSQGTGAPTKVTVAMPSSICSFGTLRMSEIASPP